MHACKKCAAVAHVHTHVGASGSGRRRAFAFTGAYFEGRGPVLFARARGARTTRTRVMGAYKSYEVRRCARRAYVRRASTHGTRETYDFVPAAFQMCGN